MSTVSSSVGGISLVDKYAKVAREYAKLRQQVQTLKAAVVDERKQREEVTLSSQSSSRQCRKLMDEVESLTFRNDQLASRVESLQEMITNGRAGERRGNKAVPRSSTLSTLEDFTQPDVTVVMNELESKTKENQMLHNKLDDLTRAHKAEVDLLRQQLNNCHQSINNQSIANQTTITPTTSKTLNDSPVSNNPFDLADDEENDEVPVQSQSIRQSIDMSIEKKAAFLKTVNTELTALCQSHKSYSTYLGQMFTNAEVSSSEITGALSKFNDSTSDLCKVLGSFLETSSTGDALNTDREQVTSEVRVYRSFIQEEFLPLMKLALSNISPSLHIELQSTYDVFTSATCNYLQQFHQLLSLADFDTCSTIVDEIVQAASKLGTSFDGFLRQQRRLKIEISPPNRANDECLAACFGRIVRQWKNISKILVNEKTAILRSLFAVDAPVVEMVTDAVLLPTNSVQVESIQPESMKPASVHHITTQAVVHEAPPMKDNSKEIEMLKEQLSQKTQSHSQLTSRVEEQQMELNLMKMKLEKFNKQAVVDATPIATPTTTTTVSPTPTSRTPTDEEYAHVYYAERLKETKARMHELEDALVYWQNECESLLRTHKDIASERTELVLKLETAESQVKVVQDDLATTRRSYEEQMSSLSEHITSLNERIVRLDAQAQTSQSNGVGDKERKKNNRRSLIFK